MAWKNGLPYSQVNRNEMGPRGSSHRFHKGGKPPSQLLAEASHSEIKLWRCLSHTSELRLCPTPFESLKPSPHRDMKIFLSANFFKKKQKSIKMGNPKKDIGVN